MLLALETVHEDCSVCLYQDNQVIALETEHAPRKQTQRLLPMIDNMLSQQGVALADVQVIAFNRGPGSFSGIRINTAVAQALAFAHDIPCVPVSDLQATAQASMDAFMADMSQSADHHSQHNHIVTVINDAKMNELFVASFSADIRGIATLIQHEMLVGYGYDFVNYFSQIQIKGSADLCNPQLPFLVGDGVALADFLPAHAPNQTNKAFVSTTHSAAHIAKIAWQGFVNNKAVAAQDAQPVYLRNKAWKTLKEQAQAKQKK